MKNNKNKSTKLECHCFQDITYLESENERVKGFNTKRKGKQITPAEWKSTFSNRLSYCEYLNAM